VKKGLDINQTNDGKVAIAILAIGEVWDQSPTKKRVIFHDHT
jgi:hypothetical protein